MKLFKNLYDYRELLKTNVKKDIRGKYTFLTTPALFLILPIPSPITVVKKFHGMTPQIRYCK